jgi:SPP1 gp7 family putative phage head morphogenesis protein
MNSSASIRDLAIRHGVYLERYTKGEAKRIIAVLEQSLKDIVGKMEATGGAWTRQRLATMLDSTRQILREAFGSIEPRLFNDLEELARQEAEKVLSDIRKSIPVTLETTAPAPSQLLASVRGDAAAGGATMAELYSQWAGNTQQAFVQAIRLGVAQGETVNKLVQRIRGKSVGHGRYEGGVMQTTTRGAEALVRTAVAHVNSAARDAVYAENADIIKGYQYVGTLDSATCLVCAPLDGKEYAADESFPVLPQHYNCRCVKVPVLKSYKELGIDLDEAPPGTRASMGGQVPEKITYQEWLAQQKPEIQNDILGPGRAALFRSGTTLSDMRTDQGRVLTLKELKDIDN